jgi:hypothetical protein
MELAESIIEQVRREEVQGAGFSTDGFKTLLSPAPGSEQSPPEAPGHIRLLPGEKCVSAAFCRFPASSGAGGFSYSPKVPSQISLYNVFQINFIIKMDNYQLGIFFTP